MQHVLTLFIAALMLLAVPLSGRAGESCAMMSGTCRDACGPGEAAEAGAFDDCAERQDCCVAHTESETRCCVFSFDQKNHGPLNCSAPEQGKCLKGSSSTLLCEKLNLCK
jgi:hypothetical protein